MAELYCWNADNVIVINTIQWGRMIPLSEKLFERIIPGASHNMEAAIE